MVKVVFYIPKGSEQKALSAMYTAGAGQIGNYDHCCFMSLGEGQFRARNGANPSIGKIGVLEKVEEYRIEVICPKNKLDLVIRELRKNHPYEEPAIDVFELYNFNKD